MGGFAGFLGGGVALPFSLALRLFLRAACLFRFQADAFELGTQTRVRFGSDASDFGFEGARGGFLRGTLRFLRGGFT
jgi:hypothetical protein